MVFVIVVALQHNEMSKHDICSKDNCLMQSVNGPKKKCSKCGKVRFLGCFGITPAEGSSDKVDAVKFVHSNGFAIYMPINDFVFVCCDDSMPSTELKKALKKPTTRSTSNTRQKVDDKPTQSNANSNDEVIETMITEFTKMKKTLATIEKMSKENSTDLRIQSDELRQIKSIATETNKSMKKVTEQSNEVVKNTKNTNDVINNTANLTPKPTHRQKSNAFNFASVLKNAGSLQNESQWPTVQSAKRKRTENIKSNLPKPVAGTKTSSGGLSVVARPKRIEKPTFTKAVWVSGFAPEESSERIAEYIISETPVNDNARFSIHKLVKKDRDITSLKFVSFKVEVNDDDFEHLINPDVWPIDIRVREFLQKQTIGDYLMPEINKTKNRAQSPEKMDTVPANSPEKNAQKIVDTIVVG